MALNLSNFIGKKYTCLLFLVALSFIWFSVAEVRAFEAKDCLNNEIIGEDLSVYQSYQGKMYYNYCPVYGADHRSFKSTSYKTNDFEYAHDSKHVYYGLFMLEGLDPTAFKTKKLSGNFLAIYDSKTVYVNSLRVPGADIDTLEFLDSDYFKDKNSVYLKELESVDEANIEHYKMTILPDADPVFFVFGYKVITNAVYWYGKKIPEADVESFELMHLGYAKDKNNVYFEGAVEFGADVKSFTEFGGYFLDKNGEHYEGKPFKDIKKFKQQYIDNHKSPQIVDESINKTIQAYETKYSGYTPQPAQPPAGSPEEAELKKMQAEIMQAQTAEQTKQLTLWGGSALGALLLIGGGVWVWRRRRKG